MNKLQIRIRKFRRLLDYLRAIGLDPRAAAENSNIDYQEIYSLDDDHLVPGFYYSILYREAVSQMQTLDTSLPWAAGIGTDAFRLMCYCMISAKTLDEALQRAQEFDKLLFPQIGHKVEVLRTNGRVKLLYHVKSSSADKIFAPDNWDRTAHLEAVAKSSGLELWFGLCGWLIAHNIELQEVKISAPYVSKDYESRLNAIFQCPVKFNADENAMAFDAKYLSYRLVHNTASMEDFLNTGPYQLWEMDKKLASTSAAIKSLIGTDFEEGLPSFEEMAECMHMSVSSLRRHLHKENTSYQQIKDECRRRVAIELLCTSDMKIADIGEQLGFSDTSSFVRSFRSWTGMTPKAFKENSREVASTA